jgi:NhaP-type Na+/H+ or K+/H+ antiporter
MKKYLKIIMLFAVAAVLNACSPAILGHLPSGMETFWIMALVLGFGWACSEFSKGTIFPSFTLQLLISIVLHDAFAPLSSQVTMIVVICTVLAAVILKSGGDEVERRLFAKIALPTILIATIGYLVTFFVMLPILMAIGVDGKTAALLAAIIGSTDPAALIPTFKRVVFRQEHKKLVDISIAESAINDAVGAIFTGAVIIMIQSGVDVSSVGSVFSGVTEAHNLLHLGKELCIGVVAGLIGWGVMRLYENHKSVNHETSYDFAVVLAVPIFVFLIASLFGGNGFLAAFITGLLADYNHGNHGFKRTLEAMEIKIDSIAKPVIFMMAGPLISVHDLWQTAGLGLAISLFFILIARPLAVFISLAFTKITFKEKLFLCIVRETGVIPIVLAVGAVSQFAELATLMPLVAWVVIWTLTIPPALTPLWAKLLDLTEEKRPITA